MTKTFSSDLCHDVDQNYCKQCVQKIKPISFKPIRENFIHFFVQILMIVMLKPRLICHQ